MDKLIIEAIDELKHKKVKTLDEYLHGSLTKEFVIYGAGGFGKEIQNVLFEHGFKPNAFLDIKAKGALQDIPIIHPENFSQKNIVVILAIVLNKITRESIVNYLNKLGFMQILDAQKIRAMYVPLQAEHSYEYLKQKKEEILKPLIFLADKQSRQTYTHNVIAHIKRDYGRVCESDERLQYFLKDIEFKKGFKSFVDCGAYTGDTFLELCKIGKTKEYIGFEPMQDSFIKLSQNVNNSNIKSCIFPAAVSNITSLVGFDNKMGSSSMNNEGSLKVMSIQLDDVLHNFNPTFIKMDIEGEEINALNGAKNIIFKSKPELAICIYHYINHFWEIPNMIYEWNLNYKFYIRTHSSACMESVLYALKG